MVKLHLLAMPYYTSQRLLVTMGDHFAISMPMHNINCNIFIGTYM